MDSKAAKDFQRFFISSLPDIQRSLRAELHRTCDGLRDLLGPERLQEASPMHWWSISKINFLHSDLRRTSDNNFKANFFVTHLAVGSANKKSSRRRVVLLNDLHARHEARNLDVIVRMARKQKFAGKVNFGGPLVEVRQESAFLFDQEGSAGKDF